MRHTPDSIYEKNYIVMAKLPSGLNIYAAGTDNEVNYRFTGSASEAMKFSYYEAVNESYCFQMNEGFHLYNRSVKVAHGLAWEPVKLV